jgi:protein-tyrosine-phosphatase/DNA-binding transcriptional ArsR family regulator
VSVVLAPPDFLQLAGHPLRWRLLQALADSDRTVQELTTVVGEAQNLVSYHLGKLRDAGLVTARRSSADGRDSYYAADLARIADLLATTGGALHPALGAAHQQPGAKKRRRTTNVLFLCTGNSARSQMAEALLRERSNGAVKTASAGSNPKPLADGAVAAMRARGIDISRNKTKHLDAVSHRRFDWVISLCDKVKEVCPDLPGDPRTIHWSMADPSSSDDPDAFERTAADLDGRITFLLAALGTDDERTTR